MFVIVKLLRQIHLTPIKKYKDFIKNKKDIFLNFFAKKYCKRAFIVILLFSLFFFAIDKKSIGRGLILGNVFSIINFLMMVPSLYNKIGKTHKKVFFITIQNMFFRYFILSLPLLISIKHDNFSLFGTIVGLMSVQLVVFFTEISCNFSSLRKK